MDWEDLIEWAKAQGKTERDVHLWFAKADATYIRDLNDDQLLEALMDNGGFSSSLEDAKIQWAGLDSETMQNYLVYMTDAWATKEN